MDRIRIINYKESGKWYTDNEVDVPDNIKMWKSDGSYENFIYENSNQMSSGFVAVVCLNHEETDDFYEALYVASELKTRAMLYEMK